MSSNSTFYRNLLDAKLNNNSLREVYLDWQRSHCSHPQKVWAYDSHTQTRRFIEVDCGRCSHCINTKINEWVTRMYAHCEDFKNVYFVTLTYRSFYNIDRPVNKLIINKLSDAIWHYDNFNETSRLGYNPCVLCKDHYQRFLKRLRSNTGFDDITYVLSGEYGHKYGRPHFHLILFSNHDIKRSDIIRAWSVALFKKNDGTYVFRRNHKKNGVSLDFPIGHVDFHHLVSNGSFNTSAKIKVDGNYMNAVNCFAYVCKYVCKRDTVNFDRVNLAYRSLFHKFTYYDVFGSEIEYKYIRKYLLDFGYDYEDLDKTINFLTTHRFKYEKFQFSPDDYVYSSQLQPSKVFTLFGVNHSIEVLPSLLVDFRKLFSPFCEFSRSTPIGSVYAARHLPEFTKGVFSRPILQETCFVVPSYFRRKAQDFLYGLRSSRKTLRSISLSLGGLLDLYRRFSTCLQTNSLPREHFFSQNDPSSIESALHKTKSYFADLATGTRILLVDNHAVSFRFSRHKRKFIEVARVPLDYWLRHWLIKLELELDRHDILLRQSNESADYLHKSIDLLESNVDSIANLRELFDIILQSEMKERQKLYHDVHKSLE